MAKKSSKMIGKMAFAALLLVIALSYSWTYTDHGRLDYRAAVSLKLTSFDVPFKPDPESDFEITLPVNLIYAASGLLPAAQVERTQDIDIPFEQGTIPARIYWPLQPLSDKPPLIVYYHGGGFVVGSVDIFDSLTREIAAETGAIVVSVEYRLAPKYPYPAAVDDAFAALLWAADAAASLGADPNQLLVGGDSAGGNLAAVTALRARDEGRPALKGQILYYPAVDVGSGASWPSETHFRDGYGLSTESMEGFQAAYIPSDADRHDPYLAPYRAADVSGVAPALMVTAGFDPLTDSAKAYAVRLVESGVRVQSAHFPRMIHGFMSVDLFSQQDQAIAQTVAFVRSVAGGG